MHDARRISITKLNAAGGRKQRNPQGIYREARGRYRDRYARGYQRLFAGEGQQRHEASAFHRSGDGMLAGGSTTALATTNDSTLAIDHLFQQINVLVIDIHGPWAMPIDEQRILLLGTTANSATFASTTARAHGARCHQKLMGSKGERTSRSAENWPPTRQNTRKQTQGPSPSGATVCRDCRRNATCVPLFVAANHRRSSSKSFTSWAFGPAARFVIQEC